ncbi:MAG: DUF1287 domain-containing protein [Pseudomonadota bacterium]|nr:DUF1287 domain-containing protein [Pseudomonadota bacterium]
MPIWPEHSIAVRSPCTQSRDRPLRNLLLVLGLLISQAVLADPSNVQSVIAAARAQIGVTTGYDGSYRRLEYPNGDVPIATGVCTDVVIRALRAIGIDLQREVHQDRKRHPELYPQRWRDRRADRSIDHRRVPNLQAWFAQHADSFAPSIDSAAYHAGDIVSWKLPGNLDHIGIVSDRRVDNRPLILHNIGRGTQEEDVLLVWPISGHYRLRQ